MLVPEDQSLTLAGDADGAYPGNVVALGFELLHCSLDTCLNRLKKLQGVLLVPPVGDLSAMGPELLGRDPTKDSP